MGLESLSFVRVTAPRCTNPMATLSVISAHAAAAGSMGLGAWPGSGHPPWAPAGTGPGDLQHGTPGRPGLCQPQRAGDRCGQAAMALLCRSSTSRCQSHPTSTCPSGARSPETSINVLRHLALDQRSHGECEYTWHFGTTNRQGRWFFFLLCWCFGFFYISPQQKISSLHFAK